MTISIQVKTGRSIDDHLPEVAALQSEVFRAFPHLCDWDAALYERLLRLYSLSCDDMLLVLVRDDGRLVGTSTGRSLCDRLGRQDATVQAFRDRGWPPEQVFYCADSVLLSAYRGQGLGVEFFRHRERHASDAGYRWTTFCTVQRADDHPKKPPDFRSLESFWSNRGYTAIPGMQLEYRWTDIGEMQPTPKRMQFRVKRLAEPDSDTKR